MRMSNVWSTKKNEDINNKTAVMSNKCKFGPEDFIITVVCADGEFEVLLMKQWFICRLSYGLKHPVFPLHVLPEFNVFKSA